MFVRVVTVLLVALLVLPVASESQPVGAKRRFKNVTRTFTNNGQIAIPGQGEATPYPVSLPVGGFKRAKIKDVNLTLTGFGHDAPDDVDILLVAPNGRNALVMSDVGGNADADNLTLTLDDEAGAGLPLDSQLSSGSFRPTNDGAIESLPAPAPLSSGATTLATFDGGNPNGEWKLFIRDDDPMENGEISGGWSLEITAKVKKKRR
jgi:subtilisin-like proprotein convertase family protein